MRAREEFVMRAAEAGVNMAGLCREFGISRKTGYKWLGRYATEGLAGLEDLERTPHRSPLRVDGDVVAAIVRIRTAHRSWGARKIAYVLGRELPRSQVPTERTVHRVLERSGLLQPTRRKRRPKSSRAAEAPRVVIRKPNDLWTVDFKGWWLAMDKTRCEPLTIRDAWSRFVLRIEVLPSTKTDGVRAVFEQVFRTYGVPKAILTDNGPPFVSTWGELGLTQLSRWWLSLGIEHHRTRPGTPSDNGGHERMHRDMAAELEAFAATTRQAQQQACERWRHDFNHHRPHEALKMKTPSEVYRRSEVSFTGQPTDYLYPEGYLVRRISKRGAVSYRGRAGFISHALIRESVGLERKSPTEFDVWYRDVLLGRLDFSTKTASIKPVRWMDRAVLLPKAAA